MQMARADWSPQESEQLATLFHRMVDYFLSYAIEDEETPREPAGAARPGLIRRPALAVPRHDLSTIPARPHRPDATNSPAPRHPASDAHRRSAPPASTARRHAPVGPLSGTAQPAAPFDNDLRTPPNRPWRPHPRPRRPAPPRLTTQ